MIEITTGVSVSEHELSFTYDRSPGPGGQNSDKVNTRVTLIFDVSKSMSLTSQQKNRVAKSLTSRINTEGILRVSSSKERTQLANRRAAVNRFVELMASAFFQAKPRKKTRITAAAKQKRLDEKKQRGALKRTRQAEVTESN